MREARVSAQGNLSATSEGRYLLICLWQATLPTRRPQEVPGKGPRHAIQHSFSASVRCYSLLQHPEDKRKKRCSGGQKYSLEPRISYKKQTMWSHHLAEGQHRGRLEQLVIKIIFIYSTQSTLARALYVT